MAKMRLKMFKMRPKMAKMRTKMTKIRPKIAGRVTGPGGFFFTSEIYSFRM